MIHATSLATIIVATLYAFANQIDQLADAVQQVRA